MKEGIDGFVGRKVRIFLKNNITYTVLVSEQSDNFIKGKDKFGELVMINLDDIRSISSIQQ